MAFPGTYNFTYYRGDTFEFTLELKNQDGTDFALAEYEGIVFTIADKRGPSGTKYTASAAKDISLPSTINCKIIPSVGRNLSGGTYVYDIQITDTTPDPDIIYTVLTGQINVLDDISGAV